MPDDTALPADPAIVEKLVASHRQFLAFLQARVRDRATAEDILQAAYVRGLDKAGAIRDSESAVAWFYRLLRNALTDHYRRAAVESRALEQAGAAAPSAHEPELKAAICACLNTLVPTLKPEYAEMIRRVDLEEEPIARVAGQLGISTNNATVRLHRARQGLKRQLERSCGTCAAHGCLDCGCGGMATV